MLYQSMKIDHFNWYWVVITDNHYHHLFSGKIGEYSYVEQNYLHGILTLSHAGICFLGPKYWRPY